MQQTIFKDKYDTQPVGEYGFHVDLEKKIYRTTRDALKGQVYLFKESFQTVDGKIYSGKFCVGISEHIVRQLQYNGAELIIFTIKNFNPNYGVQKTMHFTGSIRVKDFLEHSGLIKEEGYDVQRITGIKNLELRKI